MTSVNIVSPPTSGRKSYISAQAFNNDFFTYTTSTDTNGLTTGSLAVVSGATATNCPANRVLKENGKRLYPNANPGISYIMVGVFDPQTFFSGFINPNSPVFAVFNQDKPYFFDNADGNNTGLDQNGVSLANSGNALTTNGNVIGGLQVYSDSKITYSNAAIAAAGPAIVSTVNVAAGQVFYVMNPTADITFDAANCSTVGTQAYVFFSNAVQASSITFRTGFRVTQQVSTGALAMSLSSATTGRVANIHFVGDGFGMTEVSRSPWPWMLR